MNPGELGADIDFGVPFPGDLAGEVAPPTAGTFKDKFFAFLGRLLGECGLSLLGLESPDAALKLVKRAGGDSGEVPGVLSSAMVDSIVETVVVGEVLLLDEADVDTLLCWL